jgi:hypothetical protein
MIDIFGRCIGYHSINLSAVYSFRLFFFLGHSIRFRVSFDIDF